MDINKIDQVVLDNMLSGNWKLFPFKLYWDEETKRHLKKPAISVKKWQEHAASTTDELQALLDECDGDNIILQAVLKNVFCLDADMHEDKETGQIEKGGGLATLAKWDEQFGYVSTFAIQTPTNEGQKRFYAKPSGTFAGADETRLVNPDSTLYPQLETLSFSSVVWGEGYTILDASAPAYRPDYLFGIVEVPKYRMPSRPATEQTAEEALLVAETCLKSLKLWRAKDRKSWIDVGMILKWTALEYPEHEEQFKALYKDFSKQCRSKWEEEEYFFDDRWEGFNPNGNITIGSLVYMAQEDDENYVHPLSRPSMSQKEVEKLNAELDDVMEDTDEEGNPLLDDALSDIGNANRLIALHGDDFRWCSREKVWYVWDGKKWNEDGEVRLIKFTEDVVTQLLKEAMEEKDPDKRAKLAKHAIASQGAHAAQNMMYRAKKHSINVDEFDQDRHLLNCNNGVVNLDTGEFIPHKEAKKFLMRKIARVDYIPGADCPKYKAFVEFAHEGDEETIRFVQKARGLSISGCVDKIIPFEHGVPNSGKSTQSELMLWMLGDYGDKTNLKGFVKANKDDGGDKPNSYIASLRGKRFVVANENKGFKWDTALLKDNSGLDTLTDRQPHGQKITFPATHVLWIYGNTYPDLSDDVEDDAFFNRLCDIPYNKTIENMRASEEVQAEYHAELSGILNWCIEGFQMWRKEGIKKSERIVEATNKLRRSQDLLDVFIKETYEVTDNPSDMISKPEFTEAYNEYRAAQGQKRETPMAIGMKMNKLGEQMKFETGGAGNRFWKYLRKIDTGTQTIGKRVSITGNPADDKSDDL